MKYFNIGKYPTFIIIIFAALALGFAIASQAMALDYQVANQLTIEWAAVDPNNPGEQIEYVVYRCPADDKTAAVNLWQGAATEYTVTMSEEGRFLLGVETLRLVDVNGTFEVVSKTPIGWSDDASIAPLPFGVQFYQPPAIATGLGIKK